MQYLCQTPLLFMDGRKVLRNRKIQVDPSTVEHALFCLYNHICSKHPTGSNISPVSWWTFKASKHTQLHLRHPVLNTPTSEGPKTMSFDLHV